MNLAIPGFMKKSEVPDTGKDWISLYPGMEFQASASADTDPRVRDALKRLLTGTSNGEYDRQFIDGSESYYNDYSQAWRLLGFFIDCNAPFNNHNQCGDNQNNQQNQQNSDQPACQRFLMWAAYIDLNYSGGGLGEYQFFDRTTNSWDSSSCHAKDGRCAKMDCHLKDTSFTLLGFFKEPNYHEWMEQLFKHAGVCIWSDEEYNYMQTDRKLWPCDCSSTNQQDENGNTLYYDAKPMVEGRISLGLYTDSRCSEDYMGSMNVEAILAATGTGNDGIYTLEEGLSKWNDAFDAFKVCQPCKAYDLGFNKDLNEGREGGGQDENGQSFDCVDDAGYTDVNQCMKFRTKTEMLPAAFRDIKLAHQQRTIVEVEVLGTTYGYGGYRGSQAGLSTEFTMTQSSKNNNAPKYVFMGSVILFWAGVFVFWKAKKNAARTSTMETPLVPAEGVLA